MNVFQRAINKAGYRWGIRPFTDTRPCMLPVEGLAHEQVFDLIQQENYWQSDESLSGDGSSLARTADYARGLEALIGRHGLTSMFDAPCGDLNWMSDVIDHTGIAYIGGDVSEVALQAARRRRPDLDLRKFDICSDEFPDVDVWHCRDCLFHLSNADIVRALDRFCRSDIRYALLTTHAARMLRNLDIVTGGWRLVDLQRAPFRLSQPIERIKDYPVGREFPRYVGLWERSAIAAAIAPLLRA